MKHVGPSVLPAKRGAVYVELISDCLVRNFLSWIHRFHCGKRIINWSHTCGVIVVESLGRVQCSRASRVSVHQRWGHCTGT